MDAYLICPETKKALWLGKPIRTMDESHVERVLYYHRGPLGGSLNYNDQLLNMILWKFLAEHAHKDLRVVFSGEFDDDEYERIGSGDVESDEYLQGWPPRHSGDVSLQE